MAGLELAEPGDGGKAIDWDEGSIELAASPWQRRWASPEPTADTSGFDVVAYDFGIKQNILRLLVDHHCEVTVMPAKTLRAKMRWR